MSTPLIISQVLLWSLCIGLALCVLALARQIGILYERVAPMGALMMDRGPKVGDVAPSFALTTLTGNALQLGGKAEKSTLVFFLSPTCPVCKKLLPIIKSLARTEGKWLDVVLASDGEQPEHLAFYRKAELETFPYVLSTELGMGYRISRLPYALLIDETGLLRAKGLVNSREQLESLLTAKEMSVASVQAYLADKTA